MALPRNRGTTMSQEQPYPNCVVDGCPEPATSDSPRCLFHQSDWEMEDRLSRKLDEALSGIETAIKTLLEMQEQQQINVQFRDLERRGDLPDIRASEDQLLRGGKERLEQKRRRMKARLQEAPKIHVVPRVTEIIQINGVSRSVVAGIACELEEPFARELLFREQARLEAIQLDAALQIDPEKPLHLQDRQFKTTVPLIGGTPVHIGGGHG